MLQWWPISTARSVEHTRGPTSLGPDPYVAIDVDVVVDARTGGEPERTGALPTVGRELVEWEITLE